MVQKIYTSFILLCGALMTSAMHADTIVVEVSANASVSLGSKNFFGRPITIRGIGDTDDVFVSGDSNLLLDGFQVSVEIDGMAPVFFTDAIQAVSNNSSELGGFGNTSNSNGLILVFNDAFADYDLLTDLDPVAGFGVVGIGVGHATTEGSFRLFEVFGNATFSATVEPACPFQIGDLNEDGNVDLLDVAPFVDALATDFFVCQADINQDGTVDLLDVNPFVELLTGN